MSPNDGLHFVPSTEHLGALAYEARCQQGSIPTRDLAHDWYNGVVWQTLPKFKRALNEAHIAESARQQAVGGNGRNARRDALTLLDESGALLLVSHPEVVQELINHDWSSLFMRHRADWGHHIHLLVFGHGLLDAMDRAHKGLCAKVLPVCVLDDADPRGLMASLRAGSFDQCWPVVDHVLAQAVTQIETPAQLCPLPVLGVPGWCSANQAHMFYADRQVFRPKPTLHGNKSFQRLALRWDGSTLSS
ncbi:DUF3025 domain-containing protein [Limnobacter humi]|uniref:DUF3025 domain-containing protein n=1 Tax=Limnobacter humi TaxID=1778671 RepID=A0ABT1WJK1_9BURK|nr:DUF3025 domain-containing protein [Limnobacter humi]MCQ8897083.1 DUF3025 domain-containing protein [Limnobacter humi]